MGGIRIDGKSALSNSAYFVGAPSYGFRWNSANDAFNNVIMHDNGNMYVRGNVGIGKTNPSEKLDVAGKIKGTQLCIGSDCRSTWPSSGTSQWSASGANIYNSNSGNVGIGTTSPSAKLELVGGSTLQIGSDGDSGGDSRIYLRGGSIGDDADITMNHYGFASFDITVGKVGDGDFSIARSAGGTDFVIDGTSGNVGIGTNNPVSKLFVEYPGNGAIGLHSALSLFLHDNNAVNGNLVQIGFGDGNTIAPAVIGTKLVAGVYGKSHIFFATRDVTTDTSPTERMRITSAGNVGIGTTSPGGFAASSLDVAGDITSRNGQLITGRGDDSFVIVNRAGSAAWMQLKSMVVTGSAFENVQPASGDLIVEGNVGVGTTNPGAKLDVEGGSSTFAVGISSTSGGDIGTGIEGIADGSLGVGVFGLANDVGAGVWGAANNAGSIGVQGSSVNGIAGYFNSISGYGLIVENGNVGIGKTNPSEKLDVTGNIKASGTICANGGTDCVGDSTGFGEWTTQDSLGGALIGNTIYRATGDGFLLVSLTGSSNRWVYVRSGVDTGSGMILRGIVTSAHAIEGNPRASITLPVKNGHYIKTDWNNPDLLFWMPFGNGQLVKQ